MKRTKRMVRMMFWVMLPLMILFLGVAAPLFAQGGTWTTKTPMPTARFDPAACELNGRLHVLGGVPTSPTCSFLTTHEVYDPVTDTWDTKAPMPIPRQQFGVGVVNGVLYAVGGDWTCGGLIANVDAYDPATNTWTSKAPLSAPRASFGVGVVNGILYAIGGQTNGGLSDIVEAYDPSTDTWTTKTPMPTAQMVHAVIVVNGIIYNVGGIDASGVYNLVQAYDPSTDAWTVKSSMPTPRGFLAGGAVNGILYAVGGYNGMDTVEAYNPATDTWTREVPMPTPRAELSAGVIGGTLYVVGGFDGHNSCATNEAFTPRLTNITVSIDIKPGSFPNSINPKSHGKIPVAILSTTEFDAPSQVDRSSLTFGRTGDETSLAFCTIEDVNGDGLLDVVGHFYTEATGFKAGDTQGILKGKNIDGIPLKGTDSVRIVPQK